MSLSFDEPIGLSLLKLAHALQAVSLALIRLGMAKDHGGSMGSDSIDLCD